MELIFYISCKQLLEAEKRIRALSLIKCGLPDICESNDCDEDLSIDTQEILLNLRPINENALEQLAIEDQAAIFYVAGYAGWEMLT